MTMAQKAGREGEEGGTQQSLSHMNNSVVMGSCGDFPALHQPASGHGLTETRTGCCLRILLALVGIAPSSTPAILSLHSFELAGHAQYVKSVLTRPHRDMAARAVVVRMPKESRS